MTYCDGLKHSVLGVKKNTLERHSAESEAVALEMLGGIFLATPADLVLAITGIAGPSSPSPQKTIGSVWLAVGKRGEKPQVMQDVFSGNRQEIIEKASFIALQLLCDQASLFKG